MKKKTQENYMDWLQRNAGEFRTTKERVLDEIKRRSVLAFAAKDKTLLPTSPDLFGCVETSGRTVNNTVSELLRDGDIVLVQHGKHKRYAVNYDIT
jgi:hypothetical protein